MTREELEALAQQIRAMSPPDKLRLAADMLEQRQARIAHTIASGVVVELGAALALRELDAMGPVKARR